MSSTAGGLPEIRYILDGVQVVGNVKTSAALIELLLTLEPGQPVGLLELELARRQLLGTGFFLSVDAELARSDQRGHVVIILRVVERNTILLSDVFLGTSRLTPFWGGLDVVEGNLLGQGLTLGVAAVGSDRQWGARLTLADPYAFHLPVRVGGSGHVIDATEPLFVSTPLLLDPDQDEPLALETFRAGGELGVGLYPLSLLGVYVDVGIEHVESASELPRQTRRHIIEGASLHTIVRLTLDHDTRDNPLVPTRGYRLNLSAQLSNQALGSDYDYLKLVLRSAYHQPLGFNDSGHVLRVDLFGGIILGEAPYFERFYVGDVSALIPSRDLGMNFSGVSAPNFLDRGADNLGYETVLAGGGIEYGVPLVSGPGPLYRLEFFIGAGLFGMTTPGDLPGLRDVSIGVDVVRTGGAVVFPIDLTFDLGFRAETPIGIFGLSFANGLALASF